MLSAMDEVGAFWARFLAETGAPGGPYEAGAFANEDPEVATELGLLVRDGPKRATTSRLSSYEVSGDPLPVVGDVWVVTDGTGVPLCVTRTTEVQLRRFGEVDAAFAWDEGENDRTLAGWRAAHQQYFASIGEPLNDDTMLVLERFEKLWG
jgi:uncharacterized protein YhfF